jgi:UPF0755 protein
METQTSARRTDRHQRGDRNDDLRPRRTSMFILLVVFLVLVGGVVWAVDYYAGCQRAPEGAEEPVAYTVEEGTPANAVVDDLAEQGVISCGGFVGSLLLRGTGKAEAIRAGDYRLKTGMTLDEVMTILTTPPKKIATVELTIPPGYRLTQIADAVSEAMGIPAETFLARASKGNFTRPPQLSADASLEGFLFPETYRIPKKDTADEVIQRLLDEFTDRTASLPWGDAKALGLTPYEVVTVASMIEKEAAVQMDRPLISGVIANRLTDGMTLGIDATLLYDDPTPDGELSTADIETDGPYNTRIRAGLPPTPIASPYLWSLRAALAPSDTPFYYYVLCGDDGSHRFSVTYAEHLRNVDECLG